MPADDERPDSRESHRPAAHAGTVAELVPEPFARGTVTARDGRILSYAEHGSVDGSPVLFIPGAASGSSMAFGGEVLKAHGLRLVSFDRPGLGRSEADPAKTLESVGGDVADLVAELAGHAIPIVANSQGAPFAIAAAIAGAATLLVLVSPGDEVAHPPVTAQLPEDMGRFVRSVAQGSLGEATKAFTSFSASSLFEMIMSDPPTADAPVYQDASFRESFRRTLDEGFAQGPLGYARDTALAMSDWGLDLSAVGVPVHVLFGAEDWTHSPDQGRTLTSRLPNASLTVVPGYGGSLLWARPDLALSLCL
jgi:pimeloyl-ACP methyl ester carboxylesterase